MTDTMNTGRVADERPGAARRAAGPAIHRPADEGGAAADLGQLAARLLADARQRLTLFAGLEHLFGDPAWSILLYLYEAFAAKRPVTTTDVSVASSAPTTTALRYIGALERAGLVERATDPLDRRRSFITLSRQGRTWMERYLSRLGDETPAAA